MIQDYKGADKDKERDRERERERERVIYIERESHIKRERERESHKEREKDIEINITIIASSDQLLYTFFFIKSTQTASLALSKCVPINAFLTAALSFTAQTAFPTSCSCIFKGSYRSLNHSWFLFPRKNASEKSSTYLR